MLVHLSLSDLLDYTDWERQKWHAWFLQHGADVLKISAGPHGDGRFGAVGELVRHIFSAEKRYVERLSDRSLTDRHRSRLTTSTHCFNSVAKAGTTYGHSSKRSHLGAGISRRTSRFSSIS